MITEIGSLLTLLPNMYLDNRGRLPAHHTLLSNMYQDNRGRHSAHHTLLPYMYHDNRGRLSAHHTLLPNMYHDTRGRLSAHHTLLPDMYHDNRGRLSAHHTLLRNMELRWSQFKENLELFQHIKCLISYYFHFEVTHDGLNFRVPLISSFIAFYMQVLLAKKAFLQDKLRPSDKDQPMAITNR